MIRKSPDKEKLRLRMAGLCSRSEQCEFDISQKLRKAGLYSNEADEIIDFLKESKFLDNSRFARAYTNDKVKFSGWGRKKIRLALYAKRIPSSFITEALEGIDENIYADSLERVAGAKARDLDLGSRDDINKLYRHLLSRGYESSYITPLVKALVRKFNDDKK